MMINVKKIKFQIDCGASLSIITKCHTTRSHVTPSNKTLKVWNGTEMKPLGTTRLKVTKYSIEFVAVPDDLTPLLGARTAQQMELITVHEGVRRYIYLDLQFPNRSVTMCQTSADRLQLACLLACLLTYLLTYLLTWEQVAVDLFELNKKEYVITVDYYSNFWDIDRLTSTT